MSEERVYEEALLGIASCSTRCPCCQMHRAIAEKALGLNAGSQVPLTPGELAYAHRYMDAGIPTLTEVGSAHDHRTSEEGRDAPGPGQGTELAHYPV